MYYGDNRLATFSVIVIVTLTIHVLNPKIAVFVFIKCSNFLRSNNSKMCIVYDDLRVNSEIEGPTFKRTRRQINFGGLDTINKQNNFQGFNSMFQNPGAKWQHETKESPSVKVTKIPKTPKPKSDVGDFSLSRSGFSSAISSSVESHMKNYIDAPPNQFKVGQTFPQSKRKSRPKAKRRKVRKRVESFQRQVSDQLFTVKPNVSTTTEVNTAKSTTTTIQPTTKIRKSVATTKKDISKRLSTLFNTKSQLDTSQSLVEESTKSENLDEVKNSLVLETFPGLGGFLSMYQKDISGGKPTDTVPLDQSKPANSTSNNDHQEYFQSLVNMNPGTNEIAGFHDSTPNTSYDVSTSYQPELVTTYEEKITTIAVESESGTTGSSLVDEWSTLVPVSERISTSNDSESTQNSAISERRLRLEAMKRKTAELQDAVQVVRPHNVENTEVPLQNTDGNEQLFRPKKLKNSRKHRIFFRKPDSFHISKFNLSEDAPNLIPIESTTNDHQRLSDSYLTTTEQAEQKGQNITASVNTAFNSEAGRTERVLKSLKDPGNNEAFPSTSLPNDTAQSTLATINKLGVLIHNDLEISRKHSLHNDSEVPREHPLLKDLEAPRQRQSHNDSEVPKLHALPNGLGTLKQDSFHNDLKAATQRPLRDNLEVTRQYSLHNDSEVPTQNSLHNAILHPRGNSDRPTLEFSTQMPVQIRSHIDENVPTFSTTTTDRVPEKVAQLRVLSNVAQEIIKTLEESQNSIESSNSNSRYLNIPLNGNVPVKRKKITTIATVETTTNGNLQMTNTTFMSTDKLIYNQSGNGLTTGVSTETWLKPVTDVVTKIPSIVTVTSTISTVPTKKSNQSTEHVARNNETISVNNSSTVNQVEFEKRRSVDNLHQIKQVNGSIGLTTTRYYNLERSTVSGYEFRIKHFTSTLTASTTSWANISPPILQRSPRSSRSTKQDQEQLLHESSREYSNEVEPDEISAEFESPYPETTDDTPKGEGEISETFVPAEMTHQSINIVTDLPNASFPNRTPLTQDKDRNPTQPPEVQGILPPHTAETPPPILVEDIPNEDSVKEPVSIDAAKNESSTPANIIVSSVETMNAHNTHYRSDSGVNLLAKPNLPVEIARKSAKNHRYSDRFYKLKKGHGRQPHSHFHRYNLPPYGEPPISSTLSAITMASKRGKNTTRHWHQWNPNKLRITKRPNKNVNRSGFRSLTRSFDSTKKSVTEKSTTLFYPKSPLWTSSKYFALVKQKPPIKKPFLSTRKPVTASDYTWEYEYDSESTEIEVSTRRNSPKAGIQQRNGIHKQMVSVPGNKIQIRSMPVTSKSVHKPVIERKHTLNKEPVRKQIEEIETSDSSESGDSPSEEAPVTQAKTRNQMFTPVPKAVHRALTTILKPPQAKNNDSVKVKHPVYKSVTFNYKHSTAQPKHKTENNLGYRKVYMVEPTDGSSSEDSSGSQSEDDSASNEIPTNKLGQAYGHRIKTGSNVTPLRNHTSQYYVKSNMKQYNRPHRYKVK